MRRALWMLPAALLAACPSLDGFTGAEPGDDAGKTGTSYLELEEAARLCSLVTSCTNLGYSITFSLLVPLQNISYALCVDRLAGPLPPGRVGVSQQAQALRCAAQATSCASAAGCFPYEFVEPGDPRCQGFDAGGPGDAGGADAGDAGDAGASVPPTACSPDKKAVYDCAYNQILHCDNAYFYPGSTCLLDATGVHRCAVSKTCTATQSSCSGNVVLYCGATSNFAYGDDCSFWGAACGQDQASGLQDCIVNGLTPFCTQDAVQCISHRLRTCSGGFFSEYDCPALGGTCRPSPTPHCTVADPQCEHDDPDVGQCNGSSITLCVGGKRRTLDCASLGLECKHGTLGGYCG